ncbi:hypothetical protein ACHAPT_012431 [Fusarium lateritium]
MQSLLNSELVDHSVLEAFTKAELETPSARKFVNGATVYASRRFDLPDDFGDVVLGDFGAAVRGDEKRNHDAQPNVYRSPEVMLMTEWSYPVDIWNVGVMLEKIWDLFEGRHLFYGSDAEKKKYTTRAHLAEVVGKWKAEVDVPQDARLEDSVTRLEGEEKERFLEFVRGMFQWRPEDRKTAAQLLDDPWLRC